MYVCIYIYMYIYIYKEWLNIPLLFLWVYYEFNLYLLWTHYSPFKDLEKNLDRLFKAFSHIEL